MLAGTPHGLVHQAFAPGEMTGALLNADGWGLGWFAEDAPSNPGVLKGTLPIWSDDNATGAPHAIASKSFVAAIRSASPGLGIALANTPPYLVENRLFAHNGSLWPWSGALARDLRERVAPEAEAAVRGTTDTEWLVALWRTHFARSPINDAVGAWRSALREAADLAAKRGGGVSANLLMVEASGFVAIRFAEPGPAPSLYLSQAGSRWPGGVVVASEPLDAAEHWQSVPESSLVRVDESGVRLEVLWPCDGGG